MSSLYYINGGGSDDLEDPGNWSESSGGECCLYAPSGGDDITFDENSGHDCYLSASHVGMDAFRSVTLAAGFNYDLIQGAYDLECTSLDNYSGDHTKSTGILIAGSIGIYGSGHFVAGSGDITVGSFGVTSDYLPAAVEFESSEITVTGSYAVQGGGDGSVVDPGTSKMIYTGSTDDGGLTTFKCPLILYDLELAIALTGSYPMHDIVLNDLTLSSVADVVTTIIDAGSFMLSGDLTINDEVYNASAPSKIKLVGTGDQLITSTQSDAASKMPYLLIDKVSGTVTLSGKLQCDYDLDLNDGVFDIAGNNVVVDGTFTITDELKLRGTETITAGSVVISASSVVRYYGAGIATINNLATHFYSIVLGASKTHKVTAGTTIEVDGDFSSDGTNVTRSVLVSGTPDTPYSLKVDGTESITDNIDVTDCDASTGIEIVAVGSEDGGGNTNWDFGSTGMAGAMTCSRIW